MKIAIRNQQSHLKVPTKHLRKTVRTVLSGEKCLLDEVALVFVDNTAISELNHAFKGIRHPTDVLAFSQEYACPEAEGELQRSADIIISAQMAQENAGRFRTRPEEELLLYTIHGLLHIAGYDDQSLGKRRKMRSRENFYLSQLLGP